MKKKVLLTFDDFSLPVLKTGAMPRTTMSHDQNLFQIARAALLKGHEIYFSSIDNYLQDGEILRFSQIDPHLRVDDFRGRRDEIRPDIVVSNHVHIFAWGQAPYAKKVAVHPALYFVEMPQFYDAEQTRSQLMAVRHHVDFLIVQNDRMKDILMSFYGWLAGWDSADRILVSPLGLVEDATFVVPDRAASRAALKLTTDDQVIVNGGGIWRWTGFNDFLRGFIKAVRSGASNLVLIMTGFRQSDNLDHGAYIEETRRILAENKDLIGDRATAKGAKAQSIRIHVEEDWREASKKLPLFLSAADFGLNVNQNGLENWQAQRVRCLDYTKYGLPLLSTSGDYFSDHVLPDGAVRFESFSRDSIQAALMEISRTPGLAVKGRKAAEALRRRITNGSEMKEAFEAICRTDKRRPNLEQETMLDALWRVETAVITKDSARRFQELLGI